MPSEKPLWERFVDCYNSNFDRLSDSDGRMEWAEFIGKLTEGNFAVLRGVLEAWAEDNAKKQPPQTRGPKLGTLKYLYFRELKERRFDRPVNTNMDCARCCRTGWLKAVFSYNSQRIIHPSEYDGETFAIVHVPCVCEHGHVNADRDGVRWEERKRAAEVAYGFNFTDWEIRENILEAREAKREKESRVA